MQAAIADFWSRIDIESITAYIADQENDASRLVAAKLGFTVRGPGRGRSGEAVTVYALQRSIWLQR
jgi:hypothetical protein